MKKKNSKLSGFYLGLIFVLMYLPIAVVIVFSFNESKLPVRFTGFSLKWYQELIHDDAMLEALGNSLFLGVVSCLVSAVIGTLGAVGLSRIHWKTKGILERPTAPRVPITAETKQLTTPRNKLLPSASSIASS